jgi:hypothetical protein
MGTPNIAGGWSDPIDLSVVLSTEIHGVESRLSPDGKTLYFTKSTGADGRSGIWQADLSGVLQAHGITPHAPSPGHAS